MHKKLIRAPKTIKQAATDVDLESAINDTHTHTQIPQTYGKWVHNLLMWPLNTRFSPFKYTPPRGGSLEQFKGI